MKITQDAALLVCGPTSVFFLSTCVLFRIAERRPNCLSFVIAVLGVTLGFSIIAVVPYDVWHAVSAQDADEEDEEAPARVLLRRSWAAIYWTTAVLCYFLFPVLMEFEAAGDFSTGARLRTSLRRNVVFYIIYVVLGSAFLIWLIASGEVQGSLESWLIAASNAWGLLVLTVLMGFGLVGVPRHLWRLADPKLQLHRLYVATVTKDELRLSRMYDLRDIVQEARTELTTDFWDDHRNPSTQQSGETSSSHEEEHEHEHEHEEDQQAAALRKAKQQAFLALRNTAEKCEELQRELDHTARRLETLSSASTGAGAGAPTRSTSCPSLPSSSPSTKLPSTTCTPGEVEEGRSDMRPSLSRSTAEDFVRPTTSSSSLGRRISPQAKLQQLAQLHTSLKVAALEARRATARWDDHVLRCMFFEDLESGHYKSAAELLCIRPNSSLVVGAGAHTRTVFLRCWNQLLCFWLRSLRARALRLVSYICGFLSAVIVLGQLSMFDEKHTYSLSLLSYLFKEDRGPWTTQILCVVPLAYMTYTAYFSIFRLRVPGWYGLYGNHNTDMGSLLWCASVLSRLAAPLCYHFLLLVRVHGTTFQQFMGKMNVVPVLGESFNDIFPCLIALLSFFNLFNIYGRIVRCLSFGFVEFEFAPGDGGEDPVQEGRALVERERRRRAEENSVEMPARERLAIPLAVPAG